VVGPSVYNNFRRIRLVVKASRNVLNEQPESFNFEFAATSFKLSWLSPRRARIDGHRIENGLMSEVGNNYDNSLSDASVRKTVLSNCRAQ